MKLIARLRRAFAGIKREAEAEPPLGADEDPFELRAEERRPL